MSIHPLLPTLILRRHHQGPLGGETLARRMEQLMICTSKASITLVGWTAFAAGCAILLPTVAGAACSQWEASGDMVLHQANGYRPSFSLQRSGSELHGSATYTITTPQCVERACGEAPITHAASFGHRERAAATRGHRQVVQGEAVAEASPGLDSRRNIDQEHVA